MKKKLITHASIAFMILIAGCSSSHKPTSHNYFGSDFIQTKIKENLEEFEEHGNWVMAKQRGKCYVFSYPISSSGQYNDREENYIIITHSDNRNPSSIGIIAGLNYKENTNAIIQLDSVHIYLETYNDQAWPTFNDTAIVNRIINFDKNEFLVVNQFEDEEYSIDKYSKQGLQEAINRMEVSCS